MPQLSLSNAMQASPQRPDGFEDLRNYERYKTPQPPLLMAEAVPSWVLPSNNRTALSTLHQDSAKKSQQLQHTIRNVPYKSAVSIFATSLAVYRALVHCQAVTPQPVLGTNITVTVYSISRITSFSTSWYIGSVCIMSFQPHV